MVSLKRKIQICVVGSSKEISSEVREKAELLGSEIAKAGAILVCGGRGGVMEAAAKGAKKSGGTTVGILPTSSVEDANPYIDIKIVTGMGRARNVVNVLSGDVVIGLAGKSGTLSEIALAVNHRKPVVLLKGGGGWSEALAGKEMDGVKIYSATDPTQAVKLALELAKCRCSG